MQIEAITLLLTITKLFRKRHRSGVGGMVSCGNLVPGLLPLKKVGGVEGKKLWGRGCCSCGAPWCLFSLRPDWHIQHKTPTTDTKERAMTYL